MQTPRRAAPGFFADEDGFEDHEAVVKVALKAKTKPKAKAEAPSRLEFLAEDH